MKETDYFTYLPDNALCEALGCTAFSTGYTRILPGSAYPPVRHPDDHHFIWEKGRTLQAYQFALISEGHGQLQSAPDPTKVHEVKAVADAGEVMPQKSTFFYPKLASGLVLNPLDPAELV